VLTVRSLTYGSDCFILFISETGKERGGEGEGGGELSQKFLTLEHFLLKKPKFIPHRK